MLFALTPSIQRQCCHSSPMSTRLSTSADSSSFSPKFPMWVWNRRVAFYLTLLAGRQEPNSKKEAEHLHYKENWILITLLEKHSFSGWELGLYWVAGHDPMLITWMRPYWAMPWSAHPPFFSLLPRRPSCFTGLDHLSVSNRCNCSSWVSDFYTTTF